MYTITELAGIDYGPRASAINGHGDVCGGVFTTSGQRGAVWSGYAPGSPVLIAPESYFWGMNAVGDAVGATGLGNTPTMRACLFRGGSVIDLYSAVGEHSIAIGVNDAGRVVGWRKQNNLARGFVHESNGGGVSFIDPLPGETESMAFAVNAGGDVAGRCGSRAFLRAGGSVTEVGTASWVMGMNATRRIVGSTPKPWPAANHAVVIDASTGSPTTLEVPLPGDAIGSHGEAINDAGVVVGTSWTAATYNGNQRAFIYENGVSQDLNALIPPASGWHLEFADGINNSGQIVCDGTYNGESAVALLSPPDGFASARHFDKMLVAILVGGVASDGGGWAIVGGKPIPIDPWGPRVAADAAMPPERRDVLIALAAEALAGRITVATTRETLRRASVDAAKAGLDRLLHATVHRPREQRSPRAGGGPGRVIRGGKRVR